jgi:curved DNA-binding protein CbpA
MDGELSAAMAELGLQGQALPTEAQLRAVYRRRALALHPDKCRLDKARANATFATLTAAYKSLLDRVRGEARQAAGFHELKSSAAAAAPSEPPSRAAAPSPKFDLDRFNGVFDSTRVEDYTDHGYEEWLKSTAASDPDPDPDQELVEYREPQALHGTAAFGTTYEYGTKRVSDYSADNLSDRDLCYTDVRRAYRPPRDVPATASRRREYRSVAELEEARASASLEETAEERLGRERAEERRERAEAERLEHMRRMDRVYAERFERTSHLLMPAAY